MVSNAGNEWVQRCRKHCNMRLDGILGHRSWIHWSKEDTLHCIFWVRSFMQFRPVRGENKTMGNRVSVKDVDIVHH